MTIALIFYGLLAHIVFLIPGLAISAKLRICKNQFETIIVGYFFSAVIFGLTAFLWYITAISQNIFRTLIVAILLVCFWTLRNFFVSLQKPVIHLWLFFVSVTIITFLLTTLPYKPLYTFFPDPIYRSDRNYAVPSVKILNLAKTPANDNYIPFRQAQFFVNRMNIKTESFIREWGVNFFYRTPLMGAISGSMLLLFDDKLPINYLWTADTIFDSNIYWHYQLITHLFNYLFIFPLFLIGKAYFGRRTAWITIYTLIINPYFLYNSFFSWPKSFVAFFVLSAWYFTIVKKNYLLAALFMAVGYYAHDLIFIYLLSWLLYLGCNWIVQVYKKHWQISTASRKQFINFFSAGVICACIIIPWPATAKLLYQQQSLFLFYPFALHGLPFEPRAVVTEFFHTSFITIVEIKLQTLWYLISPVEHDYISAKDVTQYVWVLTLYSIYGAVGIVLGAFAYFGVYRLWKTMFSLITGVIILPIIVTTLMIGWPKGLGALHFAEATVALLTLMAIQVLRQFSNRWLSFFVIITQFIQFWTVLLMVYGFQPISWSYSYSSVGIVTILVLLTTSLVIVLPVQISKSKR